MRRLRVSQPSRSKIRSKKLTILIYYILFFLFCYVLHVELCLSRFAYPVLPVSPVLTVLSLRFCFGIPFLTNHLWQSSPTCHLLPFCSACPILSVQCYLSRSACPVLSVLFCLSRSACPLCLSFSACTAWPVLFCLSCTGCPILAVTFWLSHSGCSILAVSFGLLFSGSPFPSQVIITVLFCPS